MSDFDAAARAAALVPPPVARDSRDNVTEPTLTCGDTPDEAVTRRVTAVTRARESLALTDPDPLTLPPAPAFPTKTLPSWAAAQVEAVTEALQTPPDLPGVCCLGAISACTGGRVQVQVRPGWREPLAVYFTAVADPGERKSPTMREMTKPLREAEKALRDSVAEVRRIAVLERDAAQALAIQAREKVLKTHPSPDALAAAAAAEAAADALSVPELPRLLAGGDSTPEAIAGLLVKYGRIAITDTEGGLFDQLTGRRTTGPPNLDAVLQAWSGDTIAVDRRGRDPELVENPALTILLMTQPVTLARIAGDRDMVGRGLVARFLYSVPPSMVGARRTGDDVTPLDADVAASYAEHLKALAVGLHGWTDPAVIALSRPAQQVLYAHEAATERKLAPGGQLRPIAAWGAKLVGNTVRLAGLLHLAELGAEKGPRTPIGEAVMRAAVDLAGYAEAHALAALAGGEGARTGGPAAEVLAKIKEHKLSEFAIRDLQRRLRSAEWTRANAVRDAVRTLVDLGWAARVEGISSEVYVAHPAAFDDGCR